MELCVDILAGKNNGAEKKTSLNFQILIFKKGMAGEIVAAIFSHSRFGVCIYTNTPTLSFVQKKLIQKKVNPKELNSKKVYFTKVTELKIPLWYILGLEGNFQDLLL